MFPTTPCGQRVPGQIQLVDDIILKTRSWEDAMMLGVLRVLKVTHSGIMI
jgi:hypothetical protein